MPAYRYILPENSSTPFSLESDHDDDDNDDGDKVDAIQSTEVLKS